MSDKPVRILREAVVRDRTGLARTTLWRKVRDNTFPTPVPLGERSKGWVESDVDAWIASRIAAGKDATAEATARRARGVHRRHEHALAVA